MPIDVRTLFLASVVSVLSLTMAMTYVWRRRKTYPGFGAWVASSWCGFGGLALQTLRDLIPNVLSFHVANALLVSAAALVVIGLNRFTGTRPALGRYLALVLGYSLLNSYLLYIHPSLLLRIVLFSLVSGGLFALGARLTGPPLRAILDEANGLVQVALYSLAGLYLLRVLGALAFPPSSQQFMAPTPIQSLPLLGFLLAQASLSAGLIVLNGQRVERDLQAALDEYHRLRELIPICATCKQIRDDQGAWGPLESYLHQHAGVSFTHGVCPACAEAFRREAGLSSGAEAPG